MVIDAESITRFKKWKKRFIFLKIIQNTILSHRVFSVDEARRDNLRGKVQNFKYLILK